MFTSGTTAQPKGVVLTQANYCHVAEAMAGAANLGVDDRWLVTLPLFHANAQYYCFAPVINVGASVALTATFSASQWIDMANELAATHASLFAAPIRMILARTGDDTTPCRLRHTWFAQSLGPDHHRRFGQLTGTLPRQLYGMTETVAIVAADRREPRATTHRRAGTRPRGPPRRPDQPRGGRRRHARDDHGGREPGVDLFAGTSRSGDDRSLVHHRRTRRHLVPHRRPRRPHRQRSASIRRTRRRRHQGRRRERQSTEVEAILAQAPGVLEVAVIAG